MAGPRGSRTKSQKGDFYISIYMNTISDQEHVPLGKLAVCPLRSVGQDPRTHHQEITTRSVCRWRAAKAPGNTAHRV